MEFKTFDILSKLVPGALVLIVLFPTLIILNGGGLDLQTSATSYSGFSALITILFLLFSYLLGYLIEAISSWMEDGLYKTWGGAPYILLFRKTKEEGIVLKNANEIIILLQRESLSVEIKRKKVEDLSDEDLHTLYRQAKNSVYSQAIDDIMKERLGEFNSGYVFSRNIFFAFLFFSTFAFFLTYEGGYSLWNFIIPFPIFLFIFWQRCKDRALYYAREILSTAFVKS